MTNENDLLQKLMISKKMMDIHNQMPRSGQSIPSASYNIPEVESFEGPSAKYNIPQEFMSEQTKVTHNPETPTVDRIMGSKLPDEIKKLMIEHPIVQPNNMSGPTLSNELVEKAARLMNGNSEQINESTSKRQQQTNNGIPSSLTAKQIKDIVRETVEEVLSENGLLTESTQKSNEVFQFKVGKHIFEGKVMKIRKVQ